MVNFTILFLVHIVTLHGINVLIVAILTIVISSLYSLGAIRSQSNNNVESKQKHMKQILKTHQSIAYNVYHKLYVNNKHSNYSRHRGTNPKTVRDPKPPWRITAALGDSVAPKIDTIIPIRKIRHVTPI